MTIPEAVKLILESCFTAKGGEVFVLNMGDPIKIIDLARKMIFLSGLVEKNKSNPNGDIGIEIIGLNPEEKLNEELLIESDYSQTKNKYIMIEKVRKINLENLMIKIDFLEKKIINQHSIEVREHLFEIVDNYR